MPDAGERQTQVQRIRPVRPDAPPARRSWRLLSLAPLAMLLVAYQAVVPAVQGTGDAPGGFPPATPAAPPARPAPAEPVLAAVDSPPVCPPSRPLTASGKARYLQADGKTTVERDAYRPEATLTWRVTGPVLSFVEGLEAIDAMAPTVAGVLERNTVKYPGLRGDFYAFIPGDGYSEVYVRDLFTAAKAGQFLYGAAPMRSALEEFLARALTASNEDADLSKIPYPGPGSLAGFLAPDGRAEKTTATSDEEASAVQLAYLVFRTGGGVGWLGCEIDRQTVLQRLNSATERLFLGRLDPGTGLIRRAHTTDWGDVRFQAGAQFTRSDPQTELWTASIYDQAWVYLALRQLTEMNEAAGQWDKANRWRREAQRIKENTQRFLWQQDRGFFRLHVHLLPWRHPFDEDAMVAIGNAVAVYAGLAEPGQPERIFAALERARIQARATKPGVSVYPAYPTGFFSLPHMYHEGQYQNGGLWDWWGAVQITAEFENGSSNLAWEHLRSVAQDWSTHPGNVAEWQSPATNRLEGSGHYAGAAGTMSEAVVRGLFGIELDAVGFALNPRLGSHSGEIRLEQPASGTRLWLNQAAAPDVLTVRYRADHQADGRMTVLLPPDAAAQSVLFDGVPRKWVPRTAGGDHYIDLGTVPSGEHRVEVRLGRPAVPALAAQWQRLDIPNIIETGELLKTTIGVKNAGTAGWNAAGPNPIGVGYRWLNAAGQPAPGVPEGRAQLPREVAPGEAIAVPLVAAPPTDSGSYRLQVDMVQEYVMWFHQAAPANPPLELPVRVTGQPLAVEWVNVEPDFSIPFGRQTTFGLAFRNVGARSWQATGASAVRVSVRWIDAGGRPYEEPGLNVLVALPASVRPGETVRIGPSLQAPRAAGRYTARFDLMQAPQTRFSDANPDSRWAEVAVVVEP